MCKIIKDINNLKEKYINDKNIYNFEYIVSEKDFHEKMKKIIEIIKKEDKIEINDVKKYYNRNHILEISNNGIMKCKSRKNFKYIKYNENEKLYLYNEKEISIDFFEFKQNYDNIYKMKIIKIYKDNNIIEFIVNLDENKNKLFIINLLTYSNNRLDNYEYLLKVLK